MTLSSALTAIVRAFVTSPASRDEFVKKNVGVLGSLAQDDKRALWAVLQEAAR